MRIPIQPMIAASSAVLLLCQCVIVDPNLSSPGYPSQSPGYPTQLPDRIPVGPVSRLTASVNGDNVTIRDGRRVYSSFRAARPNIEQTRWRNGQNQIVIKSRGYHGPATVQLFDSRSGRELDRLMAYEIRNGRPAWAAGMQE